jgi:hypothetical protein
MQVQTIDEVIGANLRTMRGDLSLIKCAETIAFLTGKSFSESRLSRWETGLYTFTVNDLHTLSQIYGVNLMALLRPVDETVTHIETFHGSLYTVDSYVYDFFIDPRGTFTDRAEKFKERNAAGTRDVIDAINDVRDQLGTKGTIEDRYSSYKELQRIYKDLKEKVEANEAEGNADGVNREEPE